MNRAPEILTVGAAILGWIAGEMAVSDPLLTDWIQANAPALAALAPPLVAVFVWVAGKGAQKRRHPTLTVVAPVPLDISLEPARSPALELLPAPEQACEAGPADAAPRAPVDEPPAAAQPTRGGWNEERVVVLGFVVLAAIAGLIIVIASFFGSLT
jgi:hypothetical protein